MSLKSLLNNSGIYAVASFLQRGLTFILLPLYTYYLSKSEFGAMDVLYQTVLILVLLTNVGLSQGLARGFYLDSNTQEEKRKLVGAMVAFLIPVALLISVIVFFAAEPINNVIFNEAGNPLWIKLTAFFYLALCLQRLPLQLMKTTQKPKQFAMASLSCFVLVAFLNILFIVVFKWGLTGMLLANIIGFGGVGIVLFPSFLKHMTINFEFRRLKPLFLFGAAMIPALMARKIMEISDRYILPQYHNLDELGLYVMGAKISSLLEVLILVPFLYAWQPFFYSQSKNPEAPKFFARVTHYFTMLLCCVFLFMEIVSGTIVQLLGNGQYAGSESVVTLLVLAIVFNGIQYTLSPGIHIKKKLGYEAGFMGLAAMINLGLNFMFIPEYGRIGAAMATVVSFGCYLLGTAWLSQKVYPVQYPLVRIFKIIGLAMVAFLAIHLTDSVVLEIGIFILFVLVGPLLDVTYHDDFINEAKQWVKNKRQKREDKTKPDSVGEKDV